MSIPIAAIDRITRKAGVERISAKALKNFQKTLDEIGLQIAREAAQAARHAKRRTILESDIKLASGKKYL